MEGESEEQKQFLSIIDDQDNVWTFQLVGRKAVTGRIIDYLWTNDHIPITLKVKPDIGKTVEIPWGIIQTIAYERRNNHG